MKLSATGAHYESLTQLREALGGSREIKKVLVANNGLAALKGMRSIRAWLFDHIGNAEAVSFEVMSTPEDLQANAEFIRMADHHVEVPGGTNSNNYANVDLIVSTAVLQGCDAVYPGWGHASENPALPRELAKTRSKIVFLGPPEGAMFSLGDKIASTIVAQSMRVPTVPWSGSELRVTPGTINIEPEVYEKAYVTTESQCEEVCEKVGFPVMLKASEGGGGKGIRKVTQSSDVATMFQAVREEVKGCHVFVMRMLENVRHLEVQLLADKYGNCIAVRTRDCSVQRRHQKVIEEGPVVGVDPKLLQEMEDCAVRLAKAVGYVGLGTVEFMYDKGLEKFFFLELNPRIQVEHPVSELISGVNLPAALLCVGMGIPLHRIPEVRQFYGENAYGESLIDFLHSKPLPPRCHAIAVRITAEDTDAGFRPTTGHVDEISFRNSRDCWGYFSISSGGAVHQFADAQFGHIFSTGATREDARRGMVFALHGVNVRGEIRTSTAFVMELLERQEFRECDVSTAWLDQIIANQAEVSCSRDVFPALCAAAVYRMCRTEESNAEKYNSFLHAGHTPSTDYLSNRQTYTFVLGHKKYIVTVGRLNANEYALLLNGSIIVVPCREFSTGALHMSLGGRTVVAYGEEEATGTRVTINGKSTLFTTDVDPTKLRSAVPGRLVRFLVPDGGFVKENMPYAEVEVMKMILQLKSSVSGTMRVRATAGCTLVTGKLLAEIEPEDPATVSRPVLDSATWSQHLRTSSFDTRTDSILRARSAVDALYNLIQGYHFEEFDLTEKLNSIMEALPCLCLSGVTMKALSRPFLGLSDPATPNDKLRAVIECVVKRFLDDERYFDMCDRPEALEKLKDASGPDDLAAVRAADFAHHHSFRLQVVRALLIYMEKNRQLTVSCSDILNNLAKLQSPQYAMVLLQARYLQRQCEMPSFEERKAAMCRDLEDGKMELYVKHSVGFDLMCSVMFDTRSNSNHIASLSMEAFIRRAHYGVSEVKNLDIFQVHAHAAWHATWTFEPVAHEEAFDRTQAISTDLCDPHEGFGWGALYQDERAFFQGFDDFMNFISSDRHTEKTIALVFAPFHAETNPSELSKACHDLLHKYKHTILNSTTLTYITFVLGTVRGPQLLTFRRSLGFEEDAMHRNLLTMTAHRLELHRLQNYNLEPCPSPSRAVHIYYASPRGNPKPSPLECRVFVRTYVSPGDLGVKPWTEMSEPEASRMLLNIISTLEMARSDKRLGQTVFNHIFINIIEMTFAVQSMLHMFQRVAAAHAFKLLTLGVREIELRFKANTPDGFLSFRVRGINPTLYAPVVQCCVEALENGKPVLKPAKYVEDIDLLLPVRATFSQSQCDSLDTIGELDTPLNDVGSPHNGHPTRQRLRLEHLKKLLPTRRHEPFTLKHGPLPEEGLDFTADAYQPVSARQLKRLVAQGNGTVFVHDWMVLFEVCLRGRWKEFCRKRKVSSSMAPDDPMRFTELSLRVDSNGEAKLVDGVPRGPAICGMVAWRCVLQTPSFYNATTGEAQSRTIIVVANDITYQSGSFSVAEDNVFKAASCLARELGVPFIYISANSGARLGLCNEVKKLFRVSLSENDSFHYIYLTPEDYETLQKCKVRVNCQKIVDEATKETRYQILDVIGADGDNLGVENLQGSALIAGHMSLNFHTIPTLSIATGRTVGIGAYLVRLGRRVVQTKNTPIILTGASALNRLLGKEVYTSNCQLGGNQIMQPNGVTHWGAKDDLEAVSKTLRWLDFVPADSRRTKRPNTQVRYLSLPDEDPIDREVTFMPARDEPYDPRLLVTGDAARTGMFDRGSWMESQCDWAKSVVTGRATLGGIPCGVILVETRLSKKYDPADPADPNSTASFISQAGQVWFPDSARKTADAIEDFHYENLPCFIFANWRGFSGGMRDMYDEVLKFGASIVDNIRVYRAPIFIYIPPFGELRGGAWVVVDPVINHNGAVEMYCDVAARGGILEPAGLVEIKFREADVRECMRRNHPELATPSEASKQMESRLLPVYNDVAIHFADLHDTPGRMKAKGCVVDVIPWKDSRKFFFSKLKRRIRELRLAEAFVSDDEQITIGLNELRRMFDEETESAVPWNDDAKVFAWFEQNEEAVVCRGEQWLQHRQVQRLLKQIGGGERRRTAICAYEGV